MIIGVLVAAVLTFDARPPGRDPEWDPAPVFAPVVIEGWRFTPSLWNQWVVPDASETDDKPWMYLSPWLGFDNSMVLESANGHRFNFTGFDSIGHQSGPGVATSSNGHTLHYVSVRDRIRHYEVDWQNVSWVRFDFHDFNHSFGANGFDNVRVEVVDEPGTAVLIGLGGILMFLLLRKKYF
jgi:hypothetical protein